LSKVAGSGVVTLWMLYEHPETNAIVTIVATNLLHGLLFIVLSPSLATTARLVKPLPHSCPALVSSSASAESNGRGRIARGGRGVVEFVEDVPPVVRGVKELRGAKAPQPLDGQRGHRPVAWAASSGNQELSERRMVIAYNPHQVEESS
jgi:hypothetical protein